MEVFVRNLPPQCSEKKLRSFLKPHLRNCGIKTYHCKKFRAKPYGLITIHDSASAEAFLRNCGQQLTFHGRRLIMSQSRNAANPRLIRTLEMESSDLRAYERLDEPLKKRKDRRNSKFGISEFAAGYWEYEDFRPIFHSTFSLPINGKLKIAKKSLIISFERTLNAIDMKYRIEFKYSTIQSLAAGPRTAPRVTISVSEAPRMYGLNMGLSPEILELLVLQDLYYDNVKKDPLWGKRLPALGEGHEPNAGSCLVYCLKLMQASSLKEFEERFNGSGGLSECLHWPITISISASPSSIVNSIMSSFSDPRYANFPFSVKFQIQRFVQNGYLSPVQAKLLLFETKVLLQKFDWTVCADALRRLSRKLPFPGPENVPEVFEFKTALAELARESKRMKLFNYEELEDHQHLRLFHRVMVTPAGVYLEGPELETMNRVHRQYPTHSDHFVRVQFCDEDFERFNFDRRASSEIVIDKKFKNVLDSGINIAGRLYEFLGFSHSSLRSQSCWFMAPVMENGRMKTARDVISGLGDFSKIRIPARCAARIGQAFTDTNGVVKIPVGAVEYINDIERNGRCFTDGVGTISMGMLEKIWAGYPASKRSSPKLYQIRYAGAKGMVALDTRIEGEVMRLRPSMIKFTGSRASDIEICGSSSKALPMYLNRQYIKILEDRGVPAATFLRIQDLAVDTLRQTVENPINAAAFLERENVAVAAGLADVIRQLYYGNLQFTDDSFLRGIVEVAVLSRLRDIKHRARVVVQDAATLYGIVDETAVLKEGEIFCRVDRKVITGKVFVSRAPALHPGDMQPANAVSVDTKSPLMALDNCVIFSQKGPRDLPSQLSGGDLDGDQFSVIWDESLHPPKAWEAANYASAKPLQLDREVTVQDMTRFFLDFMKNDQLGRIANLHVKLADEFGTGDSRCVKLAEMHSVAVDFSKTGIPADTGYLPRHDRIKPDFMAPSPRALVAGSDVGLDPPIPLNGLDAEGDEEDEEGDEEEEDEMSQFRYLQSQNVLGKLYRRIDEQEFLRSMRAASNTNNFRSDSQNGVMRSLWSRIAGQVAFEDWAPHISWAEDLWESYDEQLLDTIQQYSPHRNQLISEVEVVAGTLLGRDGALISRRGREANRGMQEKYNRDVAFVLHCIHGASDDEDAPGLPLARAAACFGATWTETPRKLPRGRHVPDSLCSFRYVAASACLRELQKLGMRI